MKKDVLIRVRGLQMMDTEDEQEPIEIVVPGQYYYRNGSHYLLSLDHIYAQLHR